MKKQLDKVEGKSSFGDDQISYKILKLLEEEIYEPLKEIINLMIEFGKYVEVWEISKMNPLYKGGDKPKPKPNLLGPSPY